MVVYGFNEDGSDHDQTLMAVLQISQANNLKFNPDKCVFYATQVSFFRNLLSSVGLKPDPNKGKYIEDFPQPSKVSELQSFIYFMKYISRFNPELSVIA